MNEDWFYYDKDNKGDSFSTFYKLQDVTKFPHTLSENYVAIALRMAPKRIQA